MKRGGWRKSRARRGWQRRLPLVTKRRKRRACFANGFGMERSDRCVKCTTGRTGLTGHKESNGRRKRNLCRKDSIGIYGSVRRRNVLSTTLTCPLCGGGGAVFGGVGFAALVRTMFVRIFACFSTRVRRR